LIALCGAYPVRAAQPADENASTPLTISLGAGAARIPDYEGAREQHSSVFPIVNATYKTPYGIFVIGGDASEPNNNTPVLSWAMGYPDHILAGLSIDYDGGRRNDRKGTALRSGSPRLRGLGNLPGTLQYGVFNAYTVGFATANFAVRKAPRDRGHGGTIVDLSVDLSVPINKRLTFTVSPSQTWVSKQYMRSYFGVTSAQSAASGFRAYTPNDSVKSYGLAPSTNFQVTEHWLLVANLAASRLTRQAGASPIVERRNTFSPSLGLAYCW
jgi:outer membrane scaffolding protein for murein synthesis (MipA/OmpV family)